MSPAGWGGMKIVTNGDRGGGLGKSDVTDDTSELSRYNPKSP